MDGTSVLAHQPQGCQLPSCGDYQGGSDGNESEGITENWRVYCTFVGARMEEWRNRENSVRNSRTWPLSGLVSSDNLESARAWCISPGWSSFVTSTNVYEHPFQGSILVASQSSVPILLEF